MHTIFYSYYPLEGVVIPPFIPRRGALAANMCSPEPPLRPPPSEYRWSPGVLGPSKTLPRWTSNLHQILIRLGYRFGPILGPILAPKLVHVGLNFESFFALVFRTLFEAFSDPSWSHFWAQVKGPNMLKVCNCRRFYAFRASSSELLSGAFVEPSWGRFGDQIGPKNGSKKGPRRGQNVS